MAQLFGGKTPQADRFAAACWLSLVTAAPVLADALVSLDCGISKTVPIATHDVLFAEVLDMRFGSPRAGLMYFDQGYHPVGTEQAHAASSTDDLS